MLWIVRKFVPDTPRTVLTSAYNAIAYGALVEAGLQPSVHAIRERVSNTGSLKTIVDHVRALNAGKHPRQPVKIHYYSPR